MKSPFKEKTKGFKFVIFFTILSVVIVYYLFQRLRTNRQNKIINDLVMLVGDCKEIGTNPDIHIRGKYVIWQLSKIYQKNDYKPDYRIEDKSGLISSNEQLTVFLALPPRGKVLPNKNSEVWRYERSLQPAYKTYLDVCVLYWPEKKAIGMYKLTCYPPTKRPINYSVPEFGDTNSCILSWVKSLPKARP